MAHKHEGLIIIIIVNNIQYIVRRFQTECNNDGAVQKVNKTKQAVW